MLKYYRSRVLGVRVSCPKVPESWVPGFKVQGPRSQVPVLQVPGLRVQGLGSQVLILDYVEEFTRSFNLRKIRADFL